MKDREHRQAPQPAQGQTLAQPQARSASETAPAADRNAPAGQAASELRQSDAAGTASVDARPQPEQSLADALAQINELKHALAEANRALAVETSERQRSQAFASEVLRSRSWRLTAPLRWGTARARTVVRRARELITERDAAAVAAPRAVGTATEDSQQAPYETHTRAQAAYFRNYAQDPSRQKKQTVLSFLSAHPDHKGIVLCPVAYDLSLKQRPDHIMSEFAKAGYLCVMLEFGGANPTVKRREKNLYMSSMIEDFVAQLHDKPFVLYLHWPGFAYLRKLCTNALVIYDVLDDLSIFANYSRIMRQDHEFLLQSADICLFSSRQLLEANRGKTANALLYENGVHGADFANGDRERLVFPEGTRPPPAGTTVVGYHGAISELLDFDIIDRIAALDGVSLLFVGPVVAFEPANLPAVQERMERLRARDNFIHVGAKSYSELKHYLAWIDLGIVPFVLGHKTDPVSPLKLFEYLAAGKPVVGTPTKTIAEYDGAVIVASGDAFIEAIASGRWKTAYTPASRAVAQQHEWRALQVPLTEFVESRTKVSPPAALQPGPLRVDIVNINFFDWKGETVYKGGAERYVYDLARLLQTMGCEVRLLQNAVEPFERVFKGVRVVGIAASSTLDLGTISRAYEKECADADVVIASPTELACNLSKVGKVISINHGIHWDSISNTLTNFDKSRYALLFDALKNSDHCVCVDTNFINWVRTFDWTLANSLTYIPNYVDLQQFQRNEKDFDAQELTVLYPRRLYEARGLYLTLNAFDALFERIPNIRLVLCGQAVGRDAEETRAFVERHPGRVDWVEYDMEDMHRAYVDSHVVLVPTMYSEGTSLSCIEALATNNAVIATNVGGLPNLIVDGYNGLLIRPNSWDLARAIERLIGNRALLSTLARNGLETAGTFSKSTWEHRWTEVLENTIFAR